MLRMALCNVLYLLVAAASAAAQVQTLGDVSFSVPEGWKYQQKPGADFAGMALQQGNNYWVMAVYTPMPFQRRRHSGPQSRMAADRARWERLPRSSAASLL